MPKRQKKQFGGTIEKWFKQEVAGVQGITQEGLDERYGKNLGFMVRGYLYHDPTHRFGPGPLRTSLVVKMGKTKIETLNTIYHLGEPLGREPKLGDFR